MRRFGWCLSLVLLLSACGSSHQVATPPSTSTSAPVAPSLVLRGSPTSEFKCPPRFEPPVAAPAPITAPQALLLCPLGFPGQHSTAVTIAANQPAFRPLIRALSQPDEPSTGGACPAYADLQQLILTKTDRGVFQVRIPTDGCGHYERAALEALNRAR